MKIIRRISVKTKSILILIYMGIAAIIANSLAGIGIYHIINPQTNITKALSILVGLSIFLILCAFVGGAFVKKDEKA